MAQESSSYLTPWIQEIKLPSQYKDIPNESFYLDNHGHLFVGKENGLSIINGNNSIHLHMDGPVYVTGGDSDTLFYAAENDLGYLIRDERPEFHTISRKHWIPSSQRNFVPSGLVSFQNLYFVVTNHGVFSLSKGRVRLFPFQEAEINLYQVRGELFLTADNIGIMKWTGSDFTGLLTQEQIGSESVILMGAEDEKLIILTSTGAIYSMADSDSIPCFERRFPLMEKITFIENVSDELVLVDVEGDGISILNHQGREINKLGNKGGLPDREIQQLFIRKDQEIWILAPHTLHKINYPSPLNVLEFESFETGRILTSLVLKERIILGTSHGIFTVEQRDPELNKLQITKLTPDNRESVHLLTSSGKKVFAAGYEHLHSIEDGMVELIDKGSFTGIQALSNHTLFASSEKGIVRYNLTNQGWKSTLIDSSLSSSHSFVWYDDQLFFLCGNGIYRLSPNLKGTESISFHMDELLFKLVPLDRELYLVGNNQVYIYEKNEDTFLRLPSDRKAKILSGSEVILSGKSGECWIVQHDGKYSSRVQHTTDLDDLSEDHISFPVLQNLGEIINLAVRDSMLIITGKDKISLFDVPDLNDFTIKIPLRIEKTTQETSDVELYLAGLDFQSTPEPLFRYRLIPHQEKWSKWDNNRKIVFGNLRQGEYKFVAQVKDLYGRISEPVELSFTIDPPIYSTWYAYTFYGFLFLVGMFLIRKWRLLSYQRAESRISQRMQRKFDALAVEKEKSDKLVAEILPEKTATQLKTAGKSKWDKYERATVLFSDIQGFTQIAEEMNPEALIDELDKFFFHFDSVVEKYNIEKIKTIGDAYMAAGGIPEKNNTNPVEVVLAALEMQSYMQQLKSSKAKIWDLRIGIHTGPVIAGVVGHKKISYDIWGDTVNTASRMESSGTPGKVNISGITYGMVKEYFICEYRGKLPVKYKGNIDMYFVTGLRPELSVDLKEIPNKRFFIKLQLLRLGDLEDRIFEGILNKLPETLYFHKLKYARKVYNQSFLLCRSEEIDQEDRLLVRTAALMLFTGLTQSFNNFENRSSVISREILPDFKYSETQIDQICNLILSTKMPFNPNNKLEQIIIDARMEYIGRPDYTSAIKLLFQELKEAGIKINGQQFKKQQLELLYGFEFFTLAAQRLREIPGPDQMATLEQERWI
ncbi:MAG: adenylate/guanylate cyclase domain-containing protein [Bacteroidota bacterium]